MKKLGAQIRRLRKQRGLSRAAFATEVGLSAVYVEKIEAGVRVPTLPTLDRIARALGATVHVELRERRR